MTRTFAFLSVLFCTTACGSNYCQSGAKYGTECYGDVDFEGPPGSVRQPKVSGSEQTLENYRSVKKQPGLTLFGNTSTSSGSGSTSSPNANANPSSSPGQWTPSPARPQNAQLAPQQTSIGACNQKGGFMRLDYKDCPAQRR